MMEWSLFGLLLFVCFSSTHGAVQFYIGGNNGFDALGNADQMVQLRYEGKTGVYISQSVAASGAYNQSILNISNLWTGDPGQTELDFGQTNDSIGAYMQAIHHFQFIPNVASVDGPWKDDNYSGITNVTWKSYVDFIRTCGASIVMPIYTITPSEKSNASLLNIYSWIHDAHWSFLRGAALYGGGLAIQLPPYDLVPDGYTEFLYYLVDWCLQHNIRSSVIVPVGNYQVDIQSPVKWLSHFAVQPRLPTQFVFDCSYMTTIGPETASGTCANITYAATQMFSTGLGTILQCDALLVGQGTGLYGSYYNGENFDTFVATRLDPEIEFSWNGNTSPIAGLQTDHFTIRWTGFILPQYTGTHYFTVTIDDGISLVIDDITVIYHWEQTDDEETRGSIDLFAGVLYPIKIEYLEVYGNASIELRWSTFCQPLTLVPTSQLYPFNNVSVPVTSIQSPGSGTGLRADFYADENFPIDSWQGWQGNMTISVDWGDFAPNGSLIPKDFPINTFSVVWTGQILPVVSGQHIFYLLVDDGVRLYVNDLLILDNYIEETLAYHTGSINLVAGVKYNIRVEFMEIYGQATVFMYWSCGSRLTKQIVPAKQLFYRFPQPVFEPNMTISPVIETKTGGTLSPSGSGISCAPQNANLGNTCGACNFTGTSVLSPPPTSGTPPLPSGRAPRTVCAWGKSQTKITRQTPATYMFSYGSESPNSAFYIGSINGSAGGGFNQQNLTSRVPWGNGYWNHVCLSYDGHAISLYLNASLISFSYANWSTIEEFETIGGNDNGEFWHGLIYDLLAWDTSLRNEEVLTVFNYPKCASVLACDNDQFSSYIPDVCGVCGGNGKSCLGCDGVIFSGKKLDHCGVCDGDNSTCFVLPPNPCGDHNCNAAGGETCVTCLKDCRASCGATLYCGDGKCNSKETCTTCSEDCGKCAVPDCPKNATGATCSARGTCSSGSCNCASPWSGPACDITPVPIKPIIDPDAPSTSLDPSTKNSTTSSFVIAISRIEEHDQNGKVVQSVDVDTLDLHLVSTNTGTGNQYVYSTTLSNGALLKVLIFTYKKATTVEFAGQKTTIDPNAIKFNLGLALWPFKSDSNTVNYFIHSNSTAGAIVGGGSCNVQKSEDADGNLLWFSVAYNGLSLYGKFLPNALVDDTPKPFAQKWVGDGSVMLSLPFFWQEAWIDPDFSVLLDVDGKSSCKKKKVRVDIIVGVCVGVIGAAILIALAFYVWKTRQVRLSRKQWQAQRQEDNNL